MIPAQNIVAWGNVVPWADQRQVEQDLIISRGLVEIFADDILSGFLAWGFDTDPFNLFNLRCDGASTCAGIAEILRNTRQ